MEPPRSGPSPSSDATLPAVPPSTPQASHPTIPGIERPASDATLTDSPRPRPIAPGRIPTELGHYRILEPIGQGGMGTVFRAFHPGLDRYYALKVIHATEGGEDKGRDRFLLEARAAARIGKHPGIVQIHDAGCEQGWRYLAMDLVDGRSLSDVVGGHPLPNRSAAEFALAIAEAVQAAHDAGVIHRDLKPSNVLVTIEGRALVADFGLARDLFAEEGLSREGQVLGTLEYMAPEQAEGLRESVGPPADVYGIAATLYEMITGRPPFRGSTPMEVWTAVLGEEPKPPGLLNPKAHRDLQTICMKGLEKEQSRRYATARAMAEDLRRYLSGEPILARPAGPVSRAWSRVRRSPLVSTLSMALVAGAVLLASVAWQMHAQKVQSIERSAARERETERLRSDMTEGYLRELSRSGQALVEAARARRAIGDLAGMRRIAGGIEGLVADLQRLAPALAESWHYEGRMERALSRFDDAEHSQGEAILRAQAADATAGSRAVLSAALYERGILRMQRYRTRLEERRQDLIRSLDAQTGDGAAPPVPDTAQVVATYEDLREVRSLAEADLRAALSGGLPDGDARAHIAQGVLSLLQEGGSPSGAEAEFGRAIAADRYLEEAHLLLAGCAMDRGEFMEAASRFDAGHQVDRGYFPFLSGEVRALEAAAQQEEQRGVDGRDLRKRALDRVEEGLSIDDHSVELWCLKSALSVEEADAGMSRGRDGVALFTEAFAAAQRAAELGPRDLEAARADALAAWKLGVFGAASAERPDARFEHARAACDRALSIRPDDPTAALTSAQIWLSTGDWKRWGGKDPTEEYAKAIQVAETCLRTDPRNASALACVCLAHKSTGLWAATHGGDPSAEYKAAISAGERAIALAPGAGELIMNHAVCCRALAEWQREHGEDPTAAYAKSLAEYDRAWKLNPGQCLTAFNRANLLVAIAEWRRANGGDAMEAYDGAVKGYEQAIGINPKLRDATLSLAQVLLERADLLLAAGNDPEPDERRAIEVCERARSVFPRDARVLAAQGEALANVGDRRDRRGGDGKGCRQEGLAAFDRAIEASPKYWLAREGRARVLEKLGRLAEACAEWEVVVRDAPPSAGAEQELERARKLLPSTGK